MKYERMKWSNTVKGNDEKCNKKYKINVIYHCVCVRRSTTLQRRL